MTLPKKLGKEPLVEALFEMRFKPKAPASSILPGLVFTKFSGEKKIENLLPLAGLPEQILANLVPNGRYTPLVRIHWNNFMILSSNQSAGLACKLPYPGWTNGFKPAILKLADLIGDAAIVDVVERFSLKYTNIIPFELGPPRSVVDFTLKIGPHDAATNLFQIRAELPKDNLISIVQIAAEGFATFPDGSTRRGVGIDIDTISIAKAAPFAEFLSGLSGGLEYAHSEAKAIFFGCLKPEALAKLEPLYD
jgi:uncharacterized protein (TIGR04255 family)